jgi:hypothetical protein
MWTAITFAAIALTGIGFMVRFLVALLREGVLSLSRWDVAARREPEKSEHLVAVRSIYGDKSTARVVESHLHGGYSEILEKEIYAKECASGLIALDACHFSGGVGWRSIQRGDT